MKEFFINNIELVGGAFTTVFAYITGRRNQKTNELASMQKTYNTWVEDQKERYTDLKAELEQVKHQNREMQNQFNTMQLAYAKEVEMSQNWEKLHRELDKKYNDLQRLYDNLKKDFEAYKKKVNSKI